MLRFRCQDFLASLSIRFSRRTFGLVLLSFALVSISSAQVTASPSSISWNQVAVGNLGGSKVATLTNNGSSTLNISSIGFTGADPGDFVTYQKTCGSTLAASASCTVTVRFRPTVAGTRTATLTFTDSDGSSPQQVALSGLGTSGMASATPAALSFGTVTDGTTSGSQIITATNSTAGTITLSAESITGANMTDFAIASTNCGSSLAASASCAAFITFSPTTTSLESAAWNITTSSSPTPLTVGLSGTGAKGGAVSASPAALPFGSVTDGSTSTSQIITITNGTSSAVTLGAGSISGANAGDFANTSTTCGGSLAASASCTASVDFSPSTTNSESATWSMATSGNPGSLSVALSGTGVAAGGNATLSPSSLSWSKVAVGNAGGPKVATLTNNTSGTISISGIGFTGANPGDFAVYQQTCGTNLAASASCTVTILFKPTVPGNRAALLSINDGAGNSPQQVSLSGVGTGVAASPAVLSFGAVNDGSTSSPQTITITNGTSSAATLGAGAISGANAADFAVSSTTCGSSIAASASCTASITFTPTTQSAESAAWSMTASGSPTLVVSLSGAGGAVTASPSNLPFGAVSQGSPSSAQTITVSNTLTNSVTLGTGGVSGTNAHDFAVKSTTCGASLAASASCTASLVFTPSTGSAESATWSMAAGSPPTQLTVALSGTGIGGNLPISPASATLSEGATQQFSANPSGSWSASCGSVSAGGLYTAPLRPGTCTVTVTPQVGSPASATVTVMSPITLTPAAINLHALNAQQFTASAAVTWADSCHSISAAGLFTAPASPGTCTITATASTGTAYTAVATVNVDVVNYTAWRNGPGNAGVQSDELTLAPSNVNSTSFGLKWQATVDGWVNAQPLYMNGLMINGTAHNVVFIATENDSVYAFDADSGAQLWQASLIPQGATAVASASVGYTSGQPQFGVLGTPVIDPTTNTMYVVTETSEQNATYFPHRLHALGITNGQEKFGGPVLISNAQMAPIKKLQRTALLLANGSIYVGIGSMQDTPPYNGLLFQFSAANLAQQGVWVDTPSGNEGGIWMGAAAPSVDENGNVYISTGNGTFDGISNFGQAAVKFNPSLQMLDYFAPYDYNNDNANDRDLGASGVLLLPDQSGPYPHEMITCGKKPVVYLLNRDNLGHVGTTSDNIIQRIAGQVGNPAPGGTNAIACYATPAMWGQNVYFGGNYDAIKIFTLNPATGLLSTTPATTGNFVYGAKGADLVISSNGATNGVVWAIDTHTATLTASDANSLQLLYQSGLSGGVMAWTMPTVVNGHVYVGEKGVVFAYGPK